MRAESYLIRHSAETDKRLKLSTTRRSNRSRPSGPTNTSTLVLVLNAEPARRYREPLRLCAPTECPAGRPRSMGAGGHATGSFRRAATEAGRYKRIGDPAATRAVRRSHRQRTTDDFLRLRATDEILRLRTTASTSLPHERSPIPHYRQGSRQLSGRSTSTDGSTPRKGPGKLN